MTPGSARRAVAIAVGLAACLLAVPVRAAAPAYFEFRVSDGIARVDAARDVETLVEGLCAGPSWDGGPLGPQVEVTVNWGELPSWSGSIFARTPDAPVVVNIPDWIFYTSAGTGKAEAQTCDHRVVGRSALEVLERHDVTATADGAPRSQALPLLGVVLLVGVAVFALVVVVRRRRLS